MSKSEAFQHLIIMHTVIKKQFQEITYWKLGSSLWGKPQMFVHSFLVDGLLIDTGYPNIKKPFLSALEKEKIEKIVLTHHHEDHSGNVEVIKKKKNVEAYATKKCSQLMRRPVKIEPARRITWGQPKRADLLPLDLSQDLATPGGKHQFQVLETPGHSIDQISLYEANKGWLFSGDLYVHDYIKIFMREEDIETQIQSLKKLLQLDFEVLWCNHQPILKGGKQRLQTKLNFLEDFYGKVAALYQSMSNPNAKKLLQALGFKENRMMQLLSLGQLSRINMVQSVVNSLERSNQKP